MHGFELSAFLQRRSGIHGIHRRKQLACGHIHVESQHRIERPVRHLFIGRLKAGVDQHDRRQPRTGLPKPLLQLEQFAERTTARSAPISTSRSVKNATVCS